MRPHHAQVPLAQHWQRALRDPRNLYSLRAGVQDAERRFGFRIHMVLDLTNSNKYYDFYQEFPDCRELELSYVKVRVWGGEGGGRGRAGRQQGWGWGTLGPQGAGALLRQGGGRKGR